MKLNNLFRHMVEAGRALSVRRFAGAYAAVAARRDSARREPAVHRAPRPHRASRRASAPLREIILRLSVISASLGATGCADAGEKTQAWQSPIAFDTATLTVSSGDVSRRLLVEVARTDQQRSFGLMQRPSLPDTSGMIFLYDTPQPAGSGFWMFQTRVPLDIAFFDSTGTVLAVLQMAPCDSPYPDVCRTYSPGVPYTGALEVNRGWFAANGLGTGARIDLSTVR